LVTHTASAVTTTTTTSIYYSGVAIKVAYATSNAPSVGGRTSSIANVSTTTTTTTGSTNTCACYGRRNTSATSSTICAS
jgi:hypothetical protein